MFDKQLFEELSKKSESKTLDFKAIQYDFSNKTADFIKDAEKTCV
ncbi:hypothetical protein U27_06321 [Candidatus Vecturithrix granuli]|uniref:Uncharacterized protein n=1 Tax=Vecturithrix granuli TaxID=1499967 RepID=A0A081C432_VECG1|nr:hypothetical protein U27_06321 [Candidatus Vecturithrix granuli]